VLVTVDVDVDVEVDAELLWSRVMLEAVPFIEREMGNVVLVLDGRSYDPGAALTSE
jgi:hypothetical protein